MVEFVFINFAIVISLLISKEAPAMAMAETSDNQRECCGGVPGVPGIPGASGSAGPAGSPGKDGRDGRNGRDGTTGEKGDRGETGDQGMKGTNGKIGPQGPKGTTGIKGNKGDVGVKGEKGEQTEQLNWKQCAWKKVSDKDTGLFQECRFKKRHGSTALHVAFAANMRVLCSACCARWFLTFNNTECTGPMPIDGVYYTDSRRNSLHHRQIEGYCENIPAGEVRVGVHIGRCAGYSAVANVYTGWKSVSRIMIAEMPQPQQ